MHTGHISQTIVFVLLVMFLMFFMLLVFLMFLVFWLLAFVFFAFLAVRLALLCAVSHPFRREVVVLLRYLIVKFGQLNLFLVSERNALLLFIFSTLTMATPALMMPISFAAAYDRSIMR